MGAATDDRYERGLDAYASQFRIPRGEVAAWLAERVGERFGEEAIHSAAHAWDDDELSLRDRSLVVIAALITQGDAEPQLRMHTRGRSTTAPRARNWRRWRRCWRSTLDFRAR